MLKRITLTFVLINILFVNLATASDGLFYVQPSLLLQSITADTGNYRGISPKFAAGYGTVLGQGFYLAGELGISGGTLEITKNTFVAKSGVDSNRTVDFAIIPGVMISQNSLVFARTGVTNSKFNELNDNSTGYELGIGLQMALLNSWLIRGEYYYSGYDNAGNDTYKTSSLTADNFVFGVVYSFR